MVFKFTRRQSNPAKMKKTSLVLKSIPRSLPTTACNRKIRIQKAYRKLVDPSTIAEHEVAHGLMRWLRGLKATNLWASATGGLCEGTGKKWDHKTALLVTLAGFAWETDTFATTDQIKILNWKEPDFETARTIIRNAAWTRIVPCSAPSGGVKLSLEAAVKRWLLKARNMLCPFSDFIQDVGELLRQKGFISARSFAALLRHRCPDDWRYGPS